MVARRGLREENPRQQFVFFQLAIVVANAGVEVGERDAPLPCWTGNLNFRIKTKQGRRCIGGEGCPAVISAGGNMAKVTRFLDAKTPTLKAGERLVYPHNTPVQAEIAAD